MQFLSFRNNSHSCFRSIVTSTSILLPLIECRLIVFTNEKFTELCGLHRTYISDIECYQRNVPIDNIQKIADALGVASYILSMSKEEDIC